MKTTLMRLSEKPTEQELTSLLGKNLYTYYNLICNSILKELSPDEEVWNLGGRRGKYFNGYINYSKNIQVNLYLISDLDGGILKFELVIPRIQFKRIYSNRAVFTPPVLNNIEFSSKYSKEFAGAIYLSIIVDSSTIKDIIKIIVSI